MKISSNKVDMTRFQVSIFRTNYVLFSTNFHAILVQIYTLASIVGWNRKYLVSYLLLFGGRVHLQFRQSLMLSCGLSGYLARYCIFIRLFIVAL